MAILTRPLTTEDVTLLEAIDRSHATRFGLEVMVTTSALTHFARSEHSFVAERDRTAVGFVLAHAVWNGLYPVVTSQRLTTGSRDDGDVLAALLEVVTKSAYDAGVYRLEVAVPHDHARPKAMARSMGFGESGLLLLSRSLGSKGSRGEVND